MLLYRLDQIDEEHDMEKENQYEYHRNLVE